MSEAEYLRDEMEDRETDFMLGLDGCDGCCHYEGCECDGCSTCVKYGCYAKREAVEKDGD